MRSVLERCGYFITHDLPVEGAACPVYTRKYSKEEWNPGGEEPYQALLYASALGVYEASICDERVGDVFLAPGWTAYDKGRLQYQTYDVTALVREGTVRTDGRLELALTVGNGWYAGYLNGNGERALYGDHVAAWAELYLCYADGTERRLATDESWYVTTGVIRYAELYHGETQDLTNRVLHENQTSQVRILDAPLPNALIAQQCESVRITERCPAQKLTVSPSGELIIDFGQNLAGFVEITLPPLTAGEGRRTLIVDHAETLDAEGNFYTENLRTAQARDIYIYGEEIDGQTVCPHFTYHGFRYLRLARMAGERPTDEEMNALRSVRPQGGVAAVSCGFLIERDAEGSVARVDGEDVGAFLSRFIACALHTDLKPAGILLTDNVRVNRLFQNIRWTMRDNFVDVPTDCPQRDERLGWTGDIAVFAETAVGLYQTERFFDKWLMDMAAETDTEHGVPHVVPNIVGPSVGTSVWGDAATFVPWAVYERYGDTDILRRHFSLMRAWVDHVYDRCGENHLWQGDFQRGDWLGLDAPQCKPGSMNGGTDQDLVANIYYAISTRIVRDAASVLGYTNEQKVYSRRFDEVVQALGREYITESGRVVSETQTACALLLHYDLVDGAVRERIAARLGELLTENREHLTTGFIGTAALLHALSENGMHEQAATAFFQKDYPGWFYAVDRGATTIWERWDSIRPDGSFDASGMNSLNHYAYGAVGDWMLKKLGGITAAEPGFRRIRIQPYPTRGITETAQTVETVHGTISCKWSCHAGRITMDVSIPENTTALLFLPGTDRTEELSAGDYHYEYDTELSLEEARYGKDTSIGELLEEENTRDIFFEVMPELIDSPMIGFLKRKSIGELYTLPGNNSERLDQLLERLNQQSNH